MRVPTRFVFVLHNRERCKPTNTGRIAHQILEGSALCYYGSRDDPMDTDALDDPAADYAVLFPRADAVELDVSTMTPRPGRTRTLVVLDGTWHQCSRMSRRAPRVSELPCVRLPPGPPSRWGVRTPPDPRFVCTLEATIRAVATLHGSEAAAPMDDYFDRLRARMMAMKGKAPPP